ncbi:hypothetical protein RHMOL_Rhmol06G0137600 [Rhododendron molle]|uniref:Uncharacterized protein n=1 Tax=Rhododendron molle TaxID=49168 RepID=A0ACC0NCA6_RHOML|nr:hypothetical protein RHMOL_Rhmol06G0137600 [Rhododendron molle]
MADSSLVERVTSLQAEMAFYREEIEQLNTQITRLISTIRSLCRAVTNLRDFYFDQLDNKDDPKYVLGRELEDTTEDPEGNTNDLNDRSDGGNDASGEGSD